MSCVNTVVYVLAGNRTLQNIVCIYCGVCAGRKQYLAKYCVYILWCMCWQETILCKILCVYTVVYVLAGNNTLQNIVCIYCGVCVGRKQYLAKYCVYILWCMFLRWWEKRATVIQLLWWDVLYRLILLWISLTKYGLMVSILNSCW